MRILDRGCGSPLAHISEQRSARKNITMSQSHVHPSRRAFHQPHPSNISTQLHHDHQQYTPLFTSCIHLSCHRQVRFCFYLSSLLRIPTLLLFTRKASRTNTPATGILYCAFPSGLASAAVFIRKRQGRDHSGRTMEQDAWATCDLSSVMHLPLLFRILALLALGCNTRTFKRLCVTSTGASFSFSLVATIPMTFSLESEALCLKGERF
jgi:hypothetical protein